MSEGTGRPGEKRTLPVGHDSEHDRSANAPCTSPERTQALVVELGAHRRAKGSREGRRSSAVVGWHEDGEVLGPRDRLGILSLISAVSSESDGSAYPGGGR